MNKDELDAVRTRWSLLCGACDGGLPQSCTHPAEDPRGVIQQLCDAVAHLRRELSVASDLRKYLNTQIDRIHAELATAREQAEQAQAALVKARDLVMSNRESHARIARSTNDADRVIRHSLVVEIYDDVLDVLNRATPTAAPQEDPYEVADLLFFPAHQEPDELTRARLRNAVAAALQAAATPKADDIDQARWMQGGLASRGITRDGAPQADESKRGRRCASKTPCDGTPGPFDLLCDRHEPCPTCGSRGTHDIGCRGPAHPDLKDYLAGRDPEPLPAAERTTCGDSGIHPGWVCDLPPGLHQIHRQRVPGGANTWTHHAEPAETPDWVTVLDDAGVQLVFDPRNWTAPHTARGPKATDLDREHPAHVGQTCDEYDAMPDPAACVADDPDHAGMTCDEYDAALDAEPGPADTEPCCWAHNFNDLCSFARSKRGACCNDCPDWNTPAEPVPADGGGDAQRT